MTQRLNCFRAGQLAGQHQRVQAALVDDGHFLLAGGGRETRPPFVVGINVAGKRVFRISVPQRVGYVSTSEPGFALDFSGADGAKGGVGELL